MDASARADRAGLFTCPHTGVALAALLELLDDGTIGRDERVVVVSTAHGLKFADTKVGYHAGELAQIQSSHANQPVELEASPEAVIGALRARLSF